MVVVVAVLQFWLKSHLTAPVLRIPAGLCKQKNIKKHAFYPTPKPGHQAVGYTTAAAHDLATAPPPPNEGVPLEGVLPKGRFLGCN